MNLKRFVIFLLSLSALLSLCGCQSYADDLDADDLAEAGLRALSDQIEYLEAEDNFLDDYFVTPSYVTDFDVYLAPTASNINQVGVYHVRDGHAEEMEAILRDYLDRSYAENGSWYDSYIPRETPKLRDAEVRVFGNYVVYAILNENDRVTFFDTVESLLTQ